jgi:hypothetical protein
MAVNDWLKKWQTPKFYEGFKGFILYFRTADFNSKSMGCNLLSDLRQE